MQFSNSAIGKLVLNIASTTQKLDNVIESVGVKTKKN